MKGLTKALAIGTLIVATQSIAAQSAFPQGADGEPTGLPAASTYASRYLRESTQTSQFPQDTGCSAE